MVIFTAGGPKLSVPGKWLALGCVCTIMFSEQLCPSFSVSCYPWRIYYVLSYRYVCYFKSKLSWFSPSGHLKENLQDLNLQHNWYNDILNSVMAIIQLNCIYYNLVKFKSRKPNRTDTVKCINLCKCNSLATFFFNFKTTLNLLLNNNKWKQEVSVGGCTFYKCIQVNKAAPSLWFF